MIVTAKNAIQYNTILKKEKEKHAILTKKDVVVT